MNINPYSYKELQEYEIHHSQPGYVFGAALLLRCGERTAVVTTVAGIAGSAGGKNPWPRHS